MFFSTLLTGVALMSTTGWAQYVLEDDYMANGNFFDKFEFFNGSDPTHGYVDYVERDYAESTGLIGNNYGKIYMGVDHTNVVGKAGRPAVRIESTKTYDSGLIIIDIEHMPGGTCGTWPAFWMFGPNWPKNGEIDIVEGVNDQSNNDMTLHTGPGCSISKDSDMLGYVSTDNCDINAFGQSNNQGCQIKTEDDRTYGAGFNNNGGGVYATEITGDFINIFFFPRGSIPWDISSASPDPSSWGTPMAVFKGDCDIQKTFSKMSLVFTNTFCGDWAGNAWSSGSCAYKANTCVDYVQYHPEAFEEAYWSVNSLRVYKQGSSYASSEAVSSYSTSWSESYSTSYSESYSTSYSESWSASLTYSTYSSAPSQTVTWESTTKSSKTKPHYSSKTKPHYSAKTEGIAMPSGVSHDPWTASEKTYSATATSVPETSGDAGGVPYILPSETINVVSTAPTGTAEEISHESRQRPEGWASRGQRPHNRDSERAAKHLKQHKRHGHGGRRL